MGQQNCCFGSPGYVIGRGPPGGPGFGTTSGVGYGYGSRSVPIPVPATSQVMVASYMPPAATISPIAASQIPITTVPSTSVYVPTYGQNSVINPPYVPNVVQPVAGNIVAPVQPYGISSASIRPL